MTMNNLYAYAILIVVHIFIFINIEKLGTIFPSMKKLKSTKINIWIDEWNL